MWTPPLRRLTRSSSFGYDVIGFADALHRPLDPWQRWLAIHAGELLPDGRPRFRIVLVLVSRQNGKTELLVIMSLFWQFVDDIPLVLGTSTKLDYAKESWVKSIKLAKGCRELDGLHAPGRKWYRNTNGEQESWTGDPADPISRYKIAASNAEGGRSLTIHRLILDELWAHFDYSAWDASVDAGNAVPDFQVFAITNQGDDRSVVLNDLRAEALHFIETGEGDPRLGLFEWSCRPDASPSDIHALAQGNPNMGHRLNGEDLASAGARAMRLGGKALAGFRTNVMCQRVETMETKPITVASWSARADPASLITSPIVIAVDVAPDRESAAIAVAGWREDERAHIELIRMADGDPSWVVPKVAAMLAAHEVALLPDGPKHSRPAVCGDKLALGPLLAEFKAAGIEPFLLGPTQASDACGALQDAINAGTVVHLGQEQVTEALAGAYKRDVGESGWAWGKRKSGTPIPPLVAITEAFWALARSAELSYDPLQSVW